MIKDGRKEERRYKGSSISSETSCRSKSAGSKPEGRGGIVKEWGDDKDNERIAEYVIGQWVIHWCEIVWPIKGNFRECNWGFAALLEDVREGRVREVSKSEDWLIDNEKHQKSRSNELTKWFDW